MHCWVMHLKLAIPTCTIQYNTFNSHIRIGFIICSHYDKKFSLVCALHTTYLSSIRGNHVYFREERDLNEREIVFVYLQKCMKGFVYRIDLGYIREIKEKLSIKHLLFDLE